MYGSCQQSAGIAPRYFWAAALMIVSITGMSSSQQLRIISPLHGLTVIRRGRYAGLLSPSLIVYPNDQQPRDQRERSQTAKPCNVGEQRVSKRRRQEGQPS